MELVVAESRSLLRSRDYPAVQWAPVVDTRRVAALLLDLIQCQRETNRLLGLLVEAKLGRARHGDSTKGGRA